MFSIPSFPLGDTATARDHLKVADESLWTWRTGAALSEERRAAGVTAYLALGNAIEDLRALARHLTAELGAADRAYERVHAAVPRQRECDHTTTGTCGVCAAHAETLRIHGF